MIQYLNLGERVLSLDYLKEHLQINDKYKLAKDFRVYVIDKSVNDINQYSDINIKYEIQKTGKKIDRFKFLISVKECKSNQESDTPQKSEHQHNSSRKKPSRIPKKFIESHSHFVPIGWSWDEVYASPPRALMEAWNSCTDWLHYV